MSAASREHVSTEGGTTAQETQPKDDSSGESVAESEASSGELPLDQVFEILKNQRRREVLAYLRESETEVTLGEVAEHIAAIENDTTVDAISSSERKRVYVGLYQCHLPKMDDMNIVSFNQNRGRIELAENAAQLEPFIEQDDAEPRAWYQYYAGISLGSAVLFGATQVAGIATALTSSLILVGLVVAITACAGAHNYTTRTDDE